MCPAAECLALKKFSKSQIVHNETILIQSPVGSIIKPNLRPISFDPQDPQRMPPLEHTEEVLLETGLSAEKIAALREQGIVP